MFKQWEDGTVNPTRTIAFPLYFTPFAASFETQYQLITIAGTGGSVSAGGYFRSGDGATITALPAAGYVFTSFTGDATGTTNPLVLTMDGPKNIVANFTRIGATVTLSGLTATYDGTAKPASAITSPANLTVLFTYNGGATPPTAAGSYSVIGTINDPNYTGSATGTLVIAKATSTITLSGLTATYTGSAIAVGVTTAPVGLTTSVTYDGSSTAPTGSGSYTVLANVTDPNHTGTATGVLTISGTTISFQTNTPGLQISIDGATPQASPFALVLAPGAHTVSVAATQPGTAGTQYVFTNWSDSGAATHSITVGAIPATFTAVFGTQYLLTTSAGTGGTVSAGGFIASGTNAGITATPSSGYLFYNFTGATTATVNPLSLLMNGPKTITANFVPATPLLTAAITSRVDGTATNERIWTVQLTNSGSGAALNARIDSIQILAANPTSSLPLISLGSTVYPAAAPATVIGSGQSSAAPIRIIFPATSPTATRIQIRISLAADNGYTNSITLSNQVR